MLGILIVVLIASIIAVNIGFEKAGENMVSASEYIETLTTKGKVVVIDAGHGGEDPCKGCGTQGKGGSGALDPH